MKEILIYIHGKGGSAEEAEQMRFLDDWLTHAEQE